MKQKTNLLKCLIRGNNRSPYDYINLFYFQKEESFNADVAQPTTAGAITLDIAQGGTTIPGGRMITTPTVINAFFNVSSSVLVKVNCRETAAISVINNSGTDITAQQASLTIKRLC